MGDMENTAQDITEVTIEIGPQPHSNGHIVVAWYGSQRTIIGGYSTLKAAIAKAHELGWEPTIEEN